MEVEQTVFLCRDDMDSMLTAVYDAWALELKGKQTLIEVAAADSGVDMGLFSVYCTVVPDPEKALKVSGSIRRKLSDSVWELCYQALLFEAPDRAEQVHRFLHLAFKAGPSVIEYLQEPHVAKVSAYALKTGREAQHFWGFLRFREKRSEGGCILSARVALKSNILTLLAPHFADRFPGENWVIYDENRQIAAFHQAGSEWFLAELTEEMFCSFETGIQDDSYERLFQTFFRSIAIEARRNPRCQQTMLPLWCRKHMTEFQAAESLRGITKV